jgi:hypothetical protein
VIRPADDPETAGKYAKTPDPYDSRYKTLMIDQGFCFYAGEWNYPGAACTRACRGGSEMRRVHVN